MPSEGVVDEKVSVEGGTRRCRNGQCRTTSSAKSLKTFLQRDHPDDEFRRSGSRRHPSTFPRSLIERDCL